MDMHCGCSCQVQFYIAGLHWEYIPVIIQGVPKQWRLNGLWLKIKFEECPKALLKNINIPHIPCKACSGELKNTSS